MSHDAHAQRILILDFGSQYSQVIARRVREAGVYCELRPYSCSEESIRDFAPNGIILSGGPETVTAHDTPRAPECVFTMGVPVLGICYGMQTMAAQLGGQVSSAQHREFGYAAATITSSSILFRDIHDQIDAQGEMVLKVWMSHGDHVDQLPPHFETIACSVNSPIAAMADEKRHFYGVQFHPEVTHTPQGQKIIERFVHDICGCEALWHPAQIIDETIEKLRAQVGNDRVLLGLSGGVDSTVAAVLLHKAIGENLFCVFVDTGLLRYNEADQVMQTMQKQLGINVIKVDGRDYFLNALKGASDPEEKRKIIGRGFVELFEQQSKQLENIKWLAQGTIYSDIIESAAGSNQSHVIKSHHNVGGLPEKMHLKLVEPLRELFKDEVRKVGLSLGIAYENLYRHPFPGPGLGVRILGEIKPEYITTLQKADAIFIEELYKSELYYKVSQAFAVFLPVKSVAVMGDARQYEYVIALRAVETIDFMTAHWAHLPYDLLEKISNRIINEVPHVSRVVYDISSKPPATIEWE
jgi:GMP synthase (glutamine-hydrolysing)